MQMVHLPSLRALEGVEVVALADLDRGLGERVARAFGIPRVYGEVSELLAGEPSLDGLVVVCGKQWHASACLPALRAGLPVFTEKPLAATLAEGREMVETAARSGARLMVGYMKRFDPAVLAAQRCIAEGRLGTVRFVRAHDWGGQFVAGRQGVSTRPLADPPPPAPRSGAAQPSTPPPPSPEEAGRRAFAEWIEVWIHDVNLVQGLFGAIGDVLWSSPGSPRLVQVRCASGAEVLFDVGGPQPGGMPWDETLEVFGTAGRLSLSFAPPFLLHAPTALRIEAPTGVETPRCGYAEGFLEEMRHFCRALQTGEVPHPDGAEALGDLEACARIVRAAYPGVGAAL